MTVIEKYILSFEQEKSQRLSVLYQTIKEEAPEASEKISWRMPTFYFHGNLVHFACFKNHIGFYPGENGVKQFLRRSNEYKTSKGAIQFRHDQELPLQLIREIVRFRIEENLEKVQK